MGEVQFYDGVEVKEIPSTFPRQPKGTRDWYLAEIISLLKRVQSQLIVKSY